MMHRCIFYSYRLRQGCGMEQISLIHLHLYFISLRRSLNGTRVKYKRCCSIRLGKGSDFLLVVFKQNLNYLQLEEFFPQRLKEICHGCEIPQRRFTFQTFVKSILFESTCEMPQMQLYTPTMKNVNPTKYVINKSV